MIQLRGKLTVQRIGGSINVVPTAGSPPLQGKVVFPSHDEQLIKPDADYYGLSVVTVVATPRIPCVEPIANYQSEIFVGRTVDLTGGVYTEVPESGDQYYYNREQLPEIPTDLEGSHPYYIIAYQDETAYIFASKQKFYTYEQSGHLYLRSPSGGGMIRYTLNTDLNLWVLSSYVETYWSLNLTQCYSNHPYVILWSNHDIPNGSVDATDIFFHTSESTVELPTAEPTHYYYNGVRLPAIPTTISRETYPYIAILQNKDSGDYYVVGATPRLYIRPKSTTTTERIYYSGTMYHWYDKDTDQWSENSGAFGATFYLQTSTWKFIWSEYDVPSGSSPDATNVAVNASRCVPEPM